MGLLAQLMPPRGKVLLGALCYCGSVNGVGRCLLDAMRDTDRLGVFDVSAAGRLPGHQVPARPPCNDPDLAITIHPRNDAVPEDLAVVYAAGGVVKL